MAETSEKAEIQTSERKFSTLASQVSATLLETDIIKSNPDNLQKPLVDTEKCIQTIPPLLSKNKQTPQSESNSSPYTIDEAKAAYRDSLRSLLDNNIIPGQMMGQVSRLIKPSGIREGTSNLTRFLFLNDNFPNKGDQRGNIEITKKTYESWYKSTTELLTQSGIILPDHELKQCVLRLIFSHEYGHAVDRVKQIQYAEAYKKNNPDHKPKLFETNFDLSEPLNEDIYQIIAPNKSLQNLFDGIQSPPKHSEYNPARTSSERIATGFEKLGLRYALKDFGVAPEKIEAMMQSLEFNVYQKGQEEYKYILNLAKAKNMDLRTFREGIDDLVTQLSIKKEDKLANFLFAFSLGSRVIGYAFPMSEDELKKFISQ